MSNQHNREVTDLTERQRQEQQDIKEAIDYRRTMSTFGRFIQSRNPDGRYVHTAQGLSMVMQSKASQNNPASDDDDQWHGPWNNTNSK